jgi:hypothetical protein
LNNAIENLRENLYTGLSEALSQYTVIKITDPDSEKAADAARLASGCVIWISKSTMRIPSDHVYGDCLFAIGFSIFIETNSAIEGAPEYNDVLDDVIAAVLDLPMQANGDYYKIYKAEEFTEAPGNGVLTVLHPYEA